MPNVKVRGVPVDGLNRSQRTQASKQQAFKSACGRRVPLTAMLGQAQPAWVIHSALSTARAISLTAVPSKPREFLLRLASFIPPMRSSQAR